MQVPSQHLHASQTTCVSDDTKPACTNSNCQADDFFSLVLRNQCVDLAWLCPCVEASAQAQDQPHSSFNSGWLCSWALCLPLSTFFPFRMLFASVISMSSPCCCLSVCFFFPLPIWLSLSCLDLPCWMSSPSGFGGAAAGGVGLVARARTFKGAGALDIVSTGGGGLVDVVAGLFSIEGAAVTDAFSIKGAVVTGVFSDGVTIFNISTKPTMLPDAGAAGTLPPACNGADPPCTIMSHGWLGHPLMSCFRIVLQSGQWSFWYPANWMLHATVTIRIELVLCAKAQMTSYTPIMNDFELTF